MEEFCPTALSRVPRAQWHITLVTGARRRRQRHERGARENGDDDDVAVDRVNDDDDDDEDDADEHGGGDGGGAAEELSLTLPAAALPSPRRIGLDVRRDDFEW